MRPEVRAFINTMRGQKRFMGTWSTPRESIRNLVSEGKHHPGLAGNTPLYSPRFIFFR